MERTLEDITLGCLSNRTVAVQIAIPLAIFMVWEMGVCPFAYLAVTLEIFLITCELVCIEVGDDCLCLWPPELHIL